MDTGFLNVVLHHAAVIVIYSVERNEAISDSVRVL